MNCAAGPIVTNNDDNNIIKEEKETNKEKTYKLSLNKDIYQLTMSINNLDKITFFANLDNKVSLYYYESTYDLKTIIQKSKVVDKNTIQEIFDFYDNSFFKNNKITLRLSEKENYIYLSFNTIVNNGEKMECKIELQRNKFENDIILEKVIKENENIRLENQKVIRENENIKGKEKIIKDELDSNKKQILMLQKKIEEQSELQKKFEEQLELQKNFIEQLELQKKLEEQLELQKKLEEQSEIQKKFELEFQKKFIEQSEIQKKLEEQSELNKKLEEQISKLQTELKEVKRSNEINKNNKIINNYEQNKNEIKKENKQTFELLGEKIKKSELEKEINNNQMIIPMNKEEKNKKKLYIKIKIKMK